MVKVGALSTSCGLGADWIGCTTFGYEGLRRCPRGSGPPLLAHMCRSSFTAVDAHDRLEGD